MSAADIDRLAIKLRPHYHHFLRHRENEVLLTAHSHQAWPDVAREGQLEAWDDAARLVDGKWDRVFGEIVPEFQTRTGERLGTSRPEDLAVGVNTHELVYRLLSCLPPRARVLTTDAEFHSLSRQLHRSAEDGLEVQTVAIEPADGFEDRFLAALDEQPYDLAALSLVFFTTGRIVRGIDRIADGAAARGIPLLIDTYHAYGAMPLEADRWAGDVFVVGGGYKYAQTGEGNCFLLLPERAERFRPRHTGWMADFSSLEAPGGKVGYGPGGSRFFGATFDPTPIYRAVHVLRWMDRMGLTPEVLREASVLRTGRILDRFEDLALDERGFAVATPTDPDTRGPFVALRHRRARDLARALRSRGVHTDARGELLRLGPAPYTSASEIDRALNLLAELALPEAP